MQPIQIRPKAGRAAPKGIEDTSILNAFWIEITRLLGCLPTYRLGDFNLLAKTGCGNLDLACPFKSPNVVERGGNISTACEQAVVSQY
jgi:hypothetical protein